MLPKRERLRYNGLFQQVFQKGRSFYSENLKLSFTKSLELYRNKMPLVGFVISKKFSKKAVIRNRFKRKLREVYRLYRKDIENSNKLKALGLMIISLKNSSISQIEYLDYKKLSCELQSLLDKIEI
jgi:ribonuclease P protein component